MRKHWSLIIILLILAGCSATPPTPFPTKTLPPSSPTTDTMSEPSIPTAGPSVAAEESAEPAAQVGQAAEPNPTGVATLFESHPGLPLPNERGDFFAGSGLCALCHTGMEDQSGADVSIDKFWRATMMANASRDPYWQATVRTELLKQPAYQEVIEDKCATCHTPMAHFSSVNTGAIAQLLDGGYLNAENDLHTLAIDGVSCTVCHQIEETDLGQPSSFSGHYVIDAELPAGERVTYGPFPVSEANANLMTLSSGYKPVESQHVRQAALCATCHTLYTPFLDAAGEIQGEFPEQTPYLEWLYSDYRSKQSCQHCHMPHAQGGVILSSTGGDPQAPFSQHNFVGGNAFMLSILRHYAEEQAVTAATEHFDATLNRVYDQLQNRTASVTIENATLNGQELSAEVRITNLAGHKFPTGFPSRRAWIHVRVTGANGELLFESGAVDSNGLIVGNDNDADPTLYEAHYDLLTSSDQVQIYESVMQNTEGELTTTLLRAAGYIKDNRLLPSGFVKGNHLEAVSVRGEALPDENFAGGGDQLLIRVDLGDAQGSITLQVELLYQSVGYRWAKNLEGFDAPEVERFLAYYEAIPNTPILVASATAELE